MPSQEEIQDQQKFLETYRRRLTHNLVQQAQIGSATPFSITEEICDARNRIREIKATLRGWDSPTLDHPDDEETPGPQATTSAPPQGASAYTRRNIKSVE